MGLIRMPTVSVEVRWEDEKKTAFVFILQGDGLREVRRLLLLRDFSERNLDHILELTTEEMRADLDEADMAGLRVSALSQVVSLIEEARKAVLPPLHTSGCVFCLQ